MTVKFRPVEQNNRNDFEALFESTGAPNYCWCMAWRVVDDEKGTTDNERRKNSILQRVGDKIPIGILGYIEDKPVAWCSIAPRNTYRKLGGEDLEVDEGKIWSLVCFYIKRDFRKQGLSVSLIKAAVKYAKSKGAKYVEAYPVKPGSPSYRFMGFVPVFEKLGFEFVKKAGSRRNVMLLTLKT